MIQRLFENACQIPSDINSHLGTLRDLSQECTHVTELGTRDMVSSWAFLEGLKGRGKLISIDIVAPRRISTDVVTQNCKNEKVEFQFILGSSHEIEIEPTDLLFIDTIHTGEHLKKELELHARKVRKYIVFHDTESCKDELVPTIDEFLSQHKEWQKVATLHYNNGLTIITKHE